MLTAGGVIAKIGNSGNSSEPQLHMYASLPGAAEVTFSRAPVLVRINCL